MRIAFGFSRRSTLAALLVTLTLLAGAPANARVTTLYSESSRDGAVYNSNPREVVSDSSIAKVGEHFTNGSRAFFSFSLRDIPAAATINNATLRVYQSDVSNADPYTTGSSEIMVQHLLYGSSLDSSDYDTAAFNATVGVIASDNTIEWKSLDVTDQVQEDLSETTRSRTQYRLRLWPLDVVGDLANSYFIFLETGEGATPPELVVDYDYSRLTVTLAGNGTGLVMADLDGIACGSDCFEEYPIGTQVTLTASSYEQAYKFTGWSGDVNATQNATITVTLGEDTQITATFIALPGIPTMGEYAMAFLALVLACSMVWMLKRKGAV